MKISGEVIVWRGPAPFYFLPVPAEESLDIRELANELTYGWGVIPVTVRLGRTEWTTSLFPKDGRYLVPLKDRVRKAEGVGEGDTVTVDLSLGR
ncbi:DUF1905 domain-containing protein [Microlunatus sp. Gsoil 973]|jgi:hypothetical protein|uniref:DUF1905 domain-containing protein n=1 Tax=Microlunatus sp. Gsoil 973 TaxID=2672569 RepID=UPI0012B4AB50|nr:DUF1905 domain-containing protein [Microlunatus sp. Gsoil 973]QGN34719.1 DUF1905 domain-containing protein [Microlunatus sp. Gsoil 973]